MQFSSNTKFVGGVVGQTGFPTCNFLVNLIYGL
jgi:hypothetical protein